MEGTDEAKTESKTETKTETPEGASADVKIDL
jgi:hypothetical protein